MNKRWSDLLEEAVSEPGMINRAYFNFHNYSLGNQILAFSQCVERGISPGPIATYRRWQELGRQVKRGEKAILLCMPVVRKGSRVVKDEDGVEREEEFTYTHFTYKPYWFVLSQTEGKEYEMPTIPDWDKDRALNHLGIKMVEFDSANGNVQGYTLPGGKIAINPLANLPHKTLFHEIAHSILHVDKKASDLSTYTAAEAEVEAEAVALLCCESLGLPGAEFSRGYIQDWLSGRSIGEKSAQRIFHTADQILKAGYFEKEGKYDI